MSKSEPKRGEKLAVVSNPQKSEVFVRKSVDIWAVVWYYT